MKFKYSEQFMKVVDEKCKSPKIIRSIGAAPSQYFDDCEGHD